MKKETDHLEYLDKFLSVLKNSPQGKQNYSQLYETFIGKKYNPQNSNFDNIPLEAFGKPKKGSDFVAVDWSQSDKYKENFFNSAFNYLYELGLIATFPTGEVIITFKGQMKTTNTFIAEHREERLRKSVSWWQRFGVWVAIGFSICSLGISFCNYFYPSSSKVTYQTNCKGHHTYNYGEKSEPSIKSSFSIKENLTKVKKASK